MNRIIQDNIEQINILCYMHRVNSLYALGSVCTDKFSDESDVDFLISFMQMDYADYADNYFELAEKFEELLKRPIDLVTEKSLSNPYFIESVNKKQDSYLWKLKSENRDSVTTISFSSISIFVLRLQRILINLN